MTYPPHSVQGVEGWQWFLYAQRQLDVPLLPRGRTSTEDDLLPDIGRVKRPIDRELHAGGLNVAISVSSRIEIDLGCLKTNFDQPAFRRDHVGPPPT